MGLMTISKLLPPEKPDITRAELSEELGLITAQLALGNTDINGTVAMLLQRVWGLIAFWRAKVKCSYADKYRGTRKPTCGCAYCEGLYAGVMIEQDRNRSEYK